MSSISYALLLSSSLAYAQDYGLTPPPSSNEFLPPLEKELPKPVTCDASLDLMFLLDTTGSMTFHIGQAKVSASSIVREITSTYPDTRIAVSSVQDSWGWGGGFKDVPYLPVSDFSENPLEVIAAIESLSLGLGGDAPEAYPYALRRASNENWRPRAQRIVILVADSTARDPQLLQESIDHSNYNLITLTPPEISNYWMQFGIYNHGLQSQTRIDQTILEALKGRCKRV